MGLVTLANLISILAALVNTHHDHATYYELKEKGEIHDFECSNNSVIFKNTSGMLLLWTSLDPSLENSTLPEDLRNRLRVKSERNGIILQMQNLTESDSGLIQGSCWNYSSWDMDRKYIVLTVSSVQHSTAFVFSSYNIMVQPSCSAREQVTT